MASFNEINGVPSTGNHWLMTDLLRGEWGFQGFVVSDYTGDEEMIAAGFAKDGRDAARLAFLAGVDMSMQSGLYRKHLPDLVRSGEVPQAQLDQSVRRVLALKAMLGLFDDPFRRIDEKRETARSMLPADPRAGARGGPQIDRPAEERGRPAAAATIGQDDRADRPVRRGAARPGRAVGGLWRRCQGGRSRHRRCAARRRQSGR